MIIGNVVAIAQTNLKRMLAYSTISHVGFILLGIHRRQRADGYRAAMFYTLTYVIMAVGSFGMILLLSREGFEAEQLEDFKGLDSREPVVRRRHDDDDVQHRRRAAVRRLLGEAGRARRGGECGPELAGRRVRAAVGGGCSTTCASSSSCTSMSHPTTYTIEAGGTLRAVLSANGVAVLALGIFPSVLLDLCARVLP